MFHIFYVNRGYMLRLDPPALGSVYDLQKYVASSAGVDAQDQFLFLSGGASLSSNIMLSAIPGVGTDANPIFLVQRITNVQLNEPVKENAEGINELYQVWRTGVDRLDRINSNSSSAITECIELAKKSAAMSQTIVRFCGNIISEHQYLHQGWMAVISNLDDNVHKIRRRIERSTGQAEKLEMIRENGRLLLADFDTVIESLSKIVIPPTLLSPLPRSSSAPNLTDSDGSAEEMTLFDWISSKDPAYSLNSLSQLVLDHLEKTDDSDLKEAQTFFAMVQDVARKSQYRDIGGIDKRLAMLNSKLQHLEDCLLQVRDVTNRILQPIIQDSTQNVVIWQKQQLNGLKQPVKDLYDYAMCFINSKDEVVKNICQRFSTWIRQAYQRLHECTKRIVLFEEKYAGLRQRLDLARQIKEAPNIYMTAVPEVIRREKLKKEFTSWVTLHIEKCSAFIREENRIRHEFQSKLERHFLCQLFTGMADRIPQFTTDTPPKIDQNLPRVSVSHLSELRKAFPNMKELLIVGAARIFHRLAIVDPTLPPSYMGQSSQLRREQSFYDRERTSNMDAMNRNFPSTNWLSEENMEMIPSPSVAGHNFLGMTRGTTSFASSASLNAMEMQSPPQELGPLNEGDRFTLTTANSSSSTIVANAQSNRGSMSPLQPSAPISIPMPNAAYGHAGKDPIESLGSNHFSTPEEFGSFGSNSGGGGGGGAAFRSTFPIPDKHEYRQQASQTTPSAGTISSPAELESKLANARNELREMTQILTALRQVGLEVRESATTDFPLELVAEKVKEHIERLVTERVEAELEELRGTMEREKEEKAEKYAEQIGQLNIALQQESELRAAREVELADQRSQNSILNEQLARLIKERDALVEAAKHNERQAEKEAENASLLADVATQELSMAVSQSMIEIRDECPTNAASSLPGSEEDEGISRLSSRNCCTQTKIRSKDMAHFVSLNEIHEGFGALIIWNAQMNAFMAHCSSPKAHPYIVKDSCLERLGIRKSARPADPNFPCTSNATPQRTWAFTMVESIEQCQIRKMSNRYNLPIDTRFYRIGVRPIPGDFGSSISSASSVASSRR